MATETTITSAKGWSPDVQAFLAADVIPTALVNTITTVAGTVEGDDVAVRVPFVRDDVASVVPEGAQIPEADPDLAEAVVLTTKVAKLIRLSREQFEQPNAPTLLSDAASRAVIATADDVFLSQAAPKAPALTPPAGILNQGIAKAGAVAGNLDGLVDAMAAIATAGGNPSHIVLSPTAWASLRKFKAQTNSAVTILGAGTNDAVPMLLGVPVIVNKSLPSGSGLIADASDIVSAVGTVNVAQSSDVYFTSDAIGLRVTFRFGAQVIHPNRHATFTVTAGA